MALVLCSISLQTEAKKHFIHDLVEWVEDFFHVGPQHTPRFKYDATLVGFVNFADGIGRHPILFKECLEGSASMNFLSTRDIPPAVEDAQLGLPRLNPENKEDIGAVAILTDILADQALNIYEKMPDSLIKVAYTMFESTDIPKNWVSILNNKFDIAVVPDPFLVDLYRKCGVTIPTFVLPLPLMLKDFLAMNKTNMPHRPFTFGFTGGLWKRKNHIRVLEAFAQEFGNRSDVRLVLHGRFGEADIIKSLTNTIIEKNLNNVELIVGPYSHEEYLNFFKSIDCYVSLSMGEGFSITPREAIACGTPCIITNNTAQTTICSAGSVRVVESAIPVPAFYDAHYDNEYITTYGLDQIKQYKGILGTFNNPFLDEDIDITCRAGFVGNQFDCTTEAVQEAMRDMYVNYQDYLDKAPYGKVWVKQYLKENLQKLYGTLVKPQSVYLGNQNKITQDGLMTNSRALYEKYTYILGN